MSEVVNMPQLGVSLEEGTFVNWVKNLGDAVQKGEVIAEVEADKATIEVDAPAAGILLETLVKSGDTVKVGQPIARIGVAGEGAAASKPVATPVSAPLVVSAPPAPASMPVPVSAPRPVAVPQPAAEGNGRVKASPIARRLAEEKGIDLALVRGTGPGGRVQKSDVEAYQPPAPGVQLARSAEVFSPVKPAPQYVVPVGADVTEEPISRMRARIAQRTTESKQNVPHFYITAEIDMGPVLALRKQINESLPDAQKVTVNDLIVKAVALALRQFPNLNSHYYGDKIVRHKRISIGIAVALDGGGLINVVAQDADSTAISKMAERNKTMIASARTGKVDPKMIEGSTFTVSNLGPYDVEHFEAIINPPEAAILAVASSRQVPVVINGEIKIGNRMKVTLSVDHRVSDGAEGAQFIVAVRNLLENPMRLLL